MKILKYIAITLIVFALLVGVLLHQILRIKFVNEL